MNRSLLDPFQSLELPEQIEEYLDHGNARCVAYNPFGTLLAAGCQDGKVVVWDCATRGVAREYEGHSKQVTCLRWSKSGKHIISGGLDQCAVRYNVEKGAKDATVSLDAAVVSISVHHIQPHVCVASFAVGSPSRIDFTTKSVRAVPTVLLDAEAKQTKGAAQNSLLSAIALCDHAGDVIYVGQTRGTIAIVDANSLRFLDVIKVSGSPRILSLVLNSSGSHLAAICYDRVIRLYEVASFSGRAARRKSFTANEVISKATGRHQAPKAGSALLGSDAMLKLVREFQNAVERNQWRSVAFTADSEHLAAAAHSKTEHIIYIWNRDFGNLTRILEGPKQGVVDMDWHPARNMLASVSADGQIFLWVRVYRENWSAFAPDFEQLEENQEYVEREDEFDVNARAEAAPGDAPAGEEEEEDVDILTLDPDLMQDEDPDSLRHLPVHILPHDPPEASDPDKDAEGKAAAPAAEAVNEELEPSKSRPSSGGPTAAGRSKREQSSRTLDEPEALPSKRTRQ
ncbi:hypothetical protein WJX74_003022 [Apatococcus lobatus]|uniref:Anaphase-promoting complex subunit 4-like WD40 domain-containing protein n=1 Tax=Apatococcus lobatus TaxID=904363 RepID=A0AAW1QHI6_9CHLO